MKKTLLVSLAILVAVFSASSVAIALPYSGILFGVFGGNDTSVEAVTQLFGNGGIYFEPPLEYYAKVEFADLTSNGLTLDYLTAKAEEPDEFIGGTWTSDSPIRAYAVKGGNGFALYYLSMPATFGYWTTEALAAGLNDNFPAISNFVAYNGAAPVPEPSTMLLLGLGLVGVAGLSRKRIKK